MKKLDNEKRLLSRFRHVPKTVVLERIGGTNEQHETWAQRHGFPWASPRGQFIDVLELAAWLRRWYASLRHKDTPSTISAASEREFFGTPDWQGKCWEERYYALRDQRSRRQEQLVLREDMHAVLSIITREMRNLAEVVGAKYGPDARTSTVEVCENIEAAIERFTTTNSATPAPAGLPGGSAGSTATGTF